MLTFRQGVMAWRRWLLKLPLVVPTKPDEGGYFQTLSWENVDLYPGDVLLYDDARPQSRVRRLLHVPASKS